MLGEERRVDRCVYPTTRTPRNPNCTNPETCVGLSEHAIWLIDISSEIGAFFMKKQLDIIIITNGTSPQEGRPTGVISTIPIENGQFPAIRDTQINVQFDQLPNPSKVTLGSELFIGHVRSPAGSEPYTGSPEKTIHLSKKFTGSVDLSFFEKLQVRPTPDNNDSF